MRQQGCRQCERISSGDCGQHGPQFIPLSHAVPGTQVLPDKDDEIARLRAEVERLTTERNELATHLEDTVDPECRRLLDEALAHERELLRAIQSLPAPPKELRYLLTRLERAERVVEAVATQAKQHGPRCNCLGPYGSCNMRLEPTVCEALAAWQEVRDDR